MIEKIIRILGLGLRKKGLFFLSAGKGENENILIFFSGKGFQVGGVRISHLPFLRVSSNSSSPESVSPLYSISIKTVR